MATQAVADGAIIAPGAMLVGKYRVVRSVGRGGMAQVYEALQLGLGKRVAVKVLNAQYSASPILTERFFREARAASAVKSPYIVDVYDSGRLDDQRPFIVMELLDGESLYERLARRRRLAPDEVIRLALHCAKGLAKAHAAGIVHRDLKPENVFLVQTEEGQEVAKLLDFGLAKFYAGTDEDEAVQRLTRDGAVFGTPPYMSPEQVRGQVGVDHRTDLWALGCIVYEMLVGRPVWKTDQGVAMIFAAIAGGELPIPSVEQPDLPSSFDRWFRKALARKSSDRFQTALEFAEALREAFSPEEIARAAAESMAAIDTRRFNSLRPPPLSGGAAPPPPPPLALALPPAPPLATPSSMALGPAARGSGAPAAPAPAPPSSRAPMSEPPPFAVAHRRRTGLVRIGIGALVAAVAGVAIGLVVTARDEAAAPAKVGAANATPSEGPAIEDAGAAVALALPPKRPFVAQPVQDLVHAKRFADAAQELGRGAPSGQGRWLAEAWRRVSATDAAACAPQAWSAIAGEGVAFAGARLFAVTGPRGAQHVVSQGLTQEGWLLDEPVADATPEGLRLLAVRVVPVGDRFALFVVEGSEDERAVRLRARSLGPDGAPLGSAIVVQSIQGYRHLSEVALTERDGYVLAFATQTPAGAEAVAVLRVERSFEPRGKPTAVAQAGAQAGVAFGAPRLGVVGSDVVVAYTVSAGGRRAAETQVVRATAPQWGSEGFAEPIDARASRRLGPASRVADRVAVGTELALACGPSRCFLAWEDEARGAYVARLDNVSGALHVATSLGRGVGRVALAPLPSEADAVQIVSSAGGALRSTVVSPLGAQPPTLLARSGGALAEASAGPAGVRALVTEGEGAQRHALLVTAPCR